MRLDESALLLYPQIPRLALLARDDTAGVALLALAGVNPAPTRTKPVEFSQFLFGLIQVTWCVETWECRGGIYPALVG